MMLFQKQRYRHEPEKGFYGDCHRTVIACLLDLPADEVPHFGAGNVSGDEQTRRCNDWLRSKFGLVEVGVPFDGDLGKVLQWGRYMYPGHYYVLGESPRGTNHVVIVKGEDIVWDPAIDGGDLVGPSDTGHYWIYFLAKLL